MKVIPESKGLFSYDFCKLSILWVLIRNNSYDNGHPQHLIYEPRHAGLPRSGKKVWKMKFFPGQGKVREFQFYSGKFRKI